MLLARNEIEYMFGLRGFYLCPFLERFLEKGRYGCLDREIDQKRRMRAYKVLSTCSNEHKPSCNTESRHSPGRMWPTGCTRSEIGSHQVSSACSLRTMLGNLEISRMKIDQLVTFIKVCSMRETLV